MGLQRQGKLADLVQEHRAPMGDLELSFLLLDRPGERAPLVSEELAREKVLVQPRAVDLHERSVPARAVEVDGAGRELFRSARPR
jgi:hypothetical protein